MHTTSSRASGNRESRPTQEWSGGQGPRAYLRCSHLKYLSRHIFM